MKEKVLITGGSGFIGSHVKDELNKHGFQVLSIGRNDLEDIKIDLKESKLQNVIDGFLPDVVCHFASGSNIERANENKEKEFNDTVLATESLVECLKRDCLKRKTKNTKVIYLSSQAVYGLPKFLPVLEDHSTEPVTAYGENKLKAENIILQSGLNYFILRVSSVYGPMQNPQKSGVIAKFVNKMENSESPIVFNSFDNFIDLIYVKDLASATVKLIQNSLEMNLKNEIFNLGSGKPTTLKEILDILYEYYPNAPKPVLKMNPLYLDKENKGLYLDVKKIQNSLRWDCKYNVNSGIKDMFKNKMSTQKV